MQRPACPRPNPYCPSLLLRRLSATVLVHYQPDLKTVSMTLRALDQTGSSTERFLELL